MNKPISPGEPILWFRTKPCRSIPAVFERNVGKSRCCIKVVGERGLTVDKFVPLESIERPKKPNELF